MDNYYGDGFYNSLGSFFALSESFTCSGRINFEILLIEAYREGLLPHEDDKASKVDSQRKEG